MNLANKFFAQLEERKLVDWFDNECYFTHILAEMKLAGIALDRKKLVEIRRDADAVRTSAGQRWAELAPDVSITSSKQLQTLFDEGLWKTSKMTKTGSYSTDAETMREQVRNETPGAELAKLRLEFQEVTKVVNTYTDGLIEEALQWSDKKLHPDLFHLGTVTGRLSSSHPNIQNQPARGEWAKGIKECYVPDPGFEFTSADYSQIELRYFADYCGGNLLQAFVDGKDLHVETGEGMGVNRDKGKTVNFGFLLYGGGPRKLAGLLECNEEEGREKLALLGSKYPRIEAWRDHVINKTRRRGPTPWVKTRAGRIRYIPELAPLAWKRNNKAEYMAAAFNIAKKYGFHMDARNNNPRAEFKLKVDSALFSRGKRLCINYLVQGGSRDLLVLAMNLYRKRAPAGFTLVTTVHDEILTQHPIGRGEEGRALLKTCMEEVGATLGLKVPVIAEPKTGPTWFAVK
jgi:DNA polymerase I-like protein with 3'-5' exonuclease and polymerase domains